MHYEPEIYHRSRPDADKITHLPTGVIYETINEACRASGISRHRMRKLIADGRVWNRPSSIRFSKKKVRCVETGTIYDSVEDAAIANRTVPRIIRKSKLFEYTGEYTHPKPKPQHRPTPKRLTLRDDEGNDYGTSFAALAKAKKMSVRRISWFVNIDPERKFRNEWMGRPVFRNARHDGKWYWINGTIPLSNVVNFKKALGVMGVKVTVKQARNMVGDLFK